jgi:hypothetical protein
VGDNRCHRHLSRHRCDHGCPWVDRGDSLLVLHGRPARFREPGGRGARCRALGFCPSNRVRPTSIGRLARPARREGRRPHESGFPLASAFRVPGVAFRGVE